MTALVKSKGGTPNQRVVQGPNGPEHNDYRRLPATVRLGIVLLSVSLSVMSAPTQLRALSGQSACGDFSFSRGVEPDQRRVQSAKLVDAVQRGCDIDARDAIVEGNIDFGGATFAEDADFHRATFEGEAGFSGAIFVGDANFRTATFAREAYFVRATFNGTADFNEVTFDGSSRFSGATFRKGAFFLGATFRGGAGFYQAIFQGETDFSGAAIQDSAYFSDAVFQDGATFVHATFQGAAGAAANFSGATINGDFLFGSSSDNPIFTGEVVPPTSLIGRTTLRWSDVKDHFIRTGDRRNIYGEWETFFTSGGQYTSASDVRTARRRYEMRPLVYSLAAGFAFVLFVFAGSYYYWLRASRQSSRGRYGVKMFLQPRCPITRDRSVEIRLEGPGRSSSRQGDGAHRHRSCTRMAHSGPGFGAPCSVAAGMKLQATGQSSSHQRANRCQFVNAPSLRRSSVGQHVELGPGPSGLTARIEELPDREEEIVASRTAEHRRNMQATLEGIKSAAEGEA